MYFFLHILTLVFALFCLSLFPKLCKKFVVSRGNASYSKMFPPKCITIGFYCVTASSVGPPIFYPTTHVVCQRKSKRATTSRIARYKFFPWNSTAILLSISFGGLFWRYMRQLIVGWFGFSTAFHGSFQNHFHQFGGLRGFSKKSIESMNIIWMSVVLVIWKERNNRVFQGKEDMLQAICERIKLQSFWWLKSKYAIFDFDYQLLRQSPLVCLLSIF